MKKNRVPSEQRVPHARVYPTRYSFMWQVVVYGVRKYEPEWYSENVWGTYPYALKKAQAILQKCIAADAQQFNPGTRVDLIVREK